MVGLHPQFHRFSLAATVALHGALAWALLHTDGARLVAAAAPVMVSLIDSAGVERAPDRPRPLPHTEPRPMPPAPVLSSAAETATPKPRTADAPAPESAIVLSPLDADYLNNPKPRYPILSRRLGEEGRVVLRVLVRADGTPADVTVHKSSGHARLDEAALEAVRQWRFTVRRNGMAIAAPVLVPISYTLQG